MSGVRTELGPIRQAGSPRLTFLPHGSRRASIPARSPQHGGFTLLEVIVVVLIIALMAGAVAGMAYRQSDAFRLTLAGRQVYGFLRSARSFALLDERENPCLYDPATRELVEQARGKRLRLPEGVELAWRESAGREESEEGVAVARFYPDGSSDGSGVLLYAGRRELHLSLDPVFGWVRLEMQPQGAA